jgi:KDO2-lipid IV(A) lauroyltransferase
MKSRLYIVALHFLACLPLGLTRRLGRILGQLCWLTKSRMATTTLTNLALCFPRMSEQERKQLARQSLQQTLQTITEAGMAWLWPAERTLGCIQHVEGLALLQQAHAQGKGVIVLGPHLGNWEILGLYLNTLDLGQTWQLYQAPDDAALAALLLQARSRTGANMVATDTRGVALLLHALRRGEIAGILPDQVPPASGGEFAPFYGIPALTQILASRLQQKTGARIIFGYTRRIGGSTPGFQIVFRAPDPLIYAEHMPDALAAQNRSVESLITEAPDQYQWEYKRFKRQPEGRQSPY